MIKKIFFPISLCFLFLSCGYISKDEKVTNIINFNYTDFKDNSQSWKNLGIDDYRFTYLSSEFSLYDINIEVDNNSVTNIIKNNENSASLNVTIDLLINDIETHYLEFNNKVFDKNEMFLTGIEITYDEIYFSPKSVHYIYYIPEGMAVDGNFSYEIKNFIAD